MATGLDSFTRAVTAVVVCSLFMILFAFQFIGQTNSEAFADNNLTNYSYTLNNDLTTLQTNVNGAIDKMQHSSLSPLYLFIMFENAFYIPWSYLVFLVQTLIHLPGMIFPILGGTALGTAIGTGITVLFVVLTATAIFLIIKSIRTGESQR